MKDFKEILILAEARMRKTPIIKCAGMCSCLQLLRIDHSITGGEFLMSMAKIEALAPDTTYHADGSFRDNSTGFWWPPTNRRARYKWMKEQIRKL